MQETGQRQKRRRPQEPRGGLEEDNWNQIREIKRKELCEWMNDILRQLDGIKSIANIMVRQQRDLRSMHDDRSLLAQAIVAQVATVVRGSVGAVLSQRSVIFFCLCCSLVCLQTVSFSSSKDLVCVFARRFGDAWPLVPALVSQRRMGAGRRKREKVISGKCDAANFISHSFCAVCGRLWNVWGNSGEDKRGRGRLAQLAGGMPK